MDDSSGVAEVDAIDELEHEEFDLITGDVGRVDFEIFFEIIVGKLKDEVELFFGRAVNDIHEAEGK